MNINRQSSPETKREVTDVVYEAVADLFFEKVTYLNLIYSDFGDGGTYGASRGTTSTTFVRSSRIIDTSDGDLMSPKRPSRLRCSFYLRSPDKLEGYILSPGVLDSYDSSTITTNLNPLRAYAGIKFVNGEILLVIKEAGGSEKTFSSGVPITMVDATFTKTYTLEIFYNVRSVDIYIDSVFRGSYACDMVGTFNTEKTFYPFFSPGRSTDGTQVNIACEHIQFIQDR